MFSAKKIGILLGILFLTFSPIVFANELKDVDVEEVSSPTLISSLSDDETVSLMTMIEQNENIVKKEEEEQAKLAKEKEEALKKQEEAKKQSAVIPVTKNSDAMINYIMRKNSSISKDTATKIYNSVITHTNTYGVDPYLVFAIIEQESTFNPNTSYQGAYGLMQLYHTTLPYLGITMSEVYDIDKNIRAGVYEISGNLKMFGDTTLALTAYNWGSGNVKRGTYNTKYANSVLNRRANILAAVN